MKTIAVVLTFLPLTASMAQSYLEPVRPVIKQASPLRELTLGANVDTEFDDHVATTVSAIMSPSGRFGFYVSGGPLISENEGATVSVGAAYIVRDPRDRHPAFEIHGGIGYTRFTTDGIENVEANGNTSSQYYTFKAENPEQADQELKVTRFDFPLAMGFFWSFPVHDWNFQPWISPRIQIRRSDFESAPIETDLGFGTSFGLRAALRTGLGVYVGGDVLAVDDNLRDSTIGLELVAGGFYILNLN